MTGIRTRFYSCIAALTLVTLMLPTGALAEEIPDQQHSQTRTETAYGYRYWTNETTGHTFGVSCSVADWTQRLQSPGQPPIVETDPASGGYVRAYSWSTEMVDGRTLDVRRSVWVDIPYGDGAYLLKSSDGARLYYTGIAKYHEMAIDPATGTLERWAWSEGPVSLALAIDAANGHVTVQHQNIVPAPGADWSMNGADHLLTTPAEFSGYMVGANGFQWMADPGEGYVLSTDESYVRNSVGHGNVLPGAVE